MIRIKSVHIEEFRGIRYLTLELNCENFGIFGPNGSGKSSIVDAIEFCLTGDITRFSAPGQGNIKVRDHGPHIDSRNSPQKAEVTVEVDIPSLGKTATVTRTIAKPDVVNVVPNDDSILKVVEKLKGLSDIAVSRRDLAKLVVAQPGQRSVDVQSLLRLQTMDKLRKSLSGYSRLCKKELDDAVRSQQRAENELKTTLSVAKLDRKEVLNLANGQRSILGLEPIRKLEPSTNFLENSTESMNDSKTPNISKSIAIADIEAAIRAVEEVDSPKFNDQVVDIRSMLTDLTSNESTWLSTKFTDFISTGRALITDDACPLCDKEWHDEKLRLHLDSKLKTAETILKLHTNVRSSVTDITRELNGLELLIRKAMGYAKKLDQTQAKLELEEYARSLNVDQSTLLEFESNYSKIDQAISVMKKARWNRSSSIGTRLVDLKQQISVLSDDSARNEAFAFLKELQVRYKHLLIADDQRKKLVSRNHVAQAVYDHFCEASNSVLQNIYRNVAKDLTDFYKIINDDEEKFSSELGLEPAKLWFNVDFYGRGNFPASAYHSEGHQDCLGLCLYLALMKNTHGENFTIAMLDDVLMYTDSSHRRAISRLLKSKFPNTQFIITTHDRVWGIQMKSEGLVRNLQSFVDWTIAKGPSIISEQNVWSEVEEALLSNEVLQAFKLVQYYLTQVSSILAENLRVRTEYKRDIDYQVGDILFSTLETWAEILGSGISVAATWGRIDTEAIIQAKLKEARALSTRFKRAWQKAGIFEHSANWDDSKTDELRDLAKTARLLLEHIRCNNDRCGGLPYLYPRSGTPEQLRCDCGRININLKSKLSKAKTNTGGVG